MEKINQSNMMMLLHILIALFLLFSFNLPNIHSAPTQPMTRWGYVYLDEVLIEDGSITSWIDGVEYAKSEIRSGIFTIDTPGRDSSALGYKDGGEHEDTIIYRLYDGRRYYIANEFDVFEIGEIKNGDLSFHSNQPSLLKINEIAPWTNGNDYVFIYNPGDESVILDSWHVGKTDGFTQNLAGSIEPKGSKYIDLGGDALNTADEIMLSFYWGKGQWIVMDRVEYGNQHDSKGNTSLIDFPSRIGENEAIIRHSNGTDTDDCSSDFILTKARLMVVEVTNLPGNISGVVKNKIGLPVAYANVSMSNGQYGITDMNGIYKISNVPPGVYNIGVVYIGYKKYTKENITVSSGDTFLLNFILEEESSVGILIGSVRDVFGAPLKNSMINIDGIVFYTNDMGEFYINDIGVGVHNVSVSLYGYITESKIVYIMENEKTHVNFTLSLIKITVDIYGVVIDGKGNGLGNAIIMLDGIHAGVTNSTGNFHIGNVTAGQHKLTVYKQRYKKTTVDFIATHNTSKIEVFLLKTNIKVKEKIFPWHLTVLIPIACVAIGIFIFKGRGGVKGVVKGENGEGIDNANITLSGTNRRTCTNEYGQYRISFLKPGAYSLTSTRDEYWSDWHVGVINPMKITQIDFILKKRINEFVKIETQRPTTPTNEELKNMYYQDSLTVIKIKPLKKRCGGCGRLVELQWGTCPYCFTLISN